MRALRLLSAQQLELVEVPVPEPGPDEVLVRVDAASICGSDLHIAGDPDGGTVPMTLGHEIAGSVVASGAGRADTLMGLEAVVFMCWACGRCRACTASRENVCRTYLRSTPPGPGLGFDGGMAEYLVVPRRHVVDRQGIDPVVAAPLVDAGVTAYRAIESVRDRLVPGAVAAVLGAAGGLGHMAVQILAATSSARIVAVDQDVSSGGATPSAPDRRHQPPQPSPPAASAPRDARTDSRPAESHPPSSPSPTDSNTAHTRRAAATATTPTHPDASPQQ